MTTPAPHPDRAEQTQPGGYVPPVVGAPTWPWDDDGMYEVPGSRLRELRDAEADRDRLRAVIAAAYVDLLAGRVDEATAALRAAGGRP